MEQARNPKEQAEVFQKKLNEDGGNAMGSEMGGRR
jgi:hypothetical protein